MEPKEAQQLLQDVSNLTADVTRLEVAVAACQAQIDQAESERLVKSAKLGKAEHNRELREAKKRLSEAKKAVAAMPDADRELAEVTPVVAEESVEAHAGLAASNGGKG